MCVCVGGGGGLGSEYVYVCTLTCTCTYHISLHSSAELVYTFALTHTRVSAVIYFKSYLLPSLNLSLCKELTYIGMN